MFEARYGPITFDIYLQACEARALLRDSKGDPTINACNRTLQTQERFQQEMLSWSSLEPVLNDYTKAHVEYEKLNGEQKIILRNKRLALLLTNDDVLEKETEGGPRKKRTAMVAATVETEKLVVFAKKGRGSGSVRMQALRSDSYGTLHKAGERADKVRSVGTFRAEDHQLQNLQG